MRKPLSALLCHILLSVSCAVIAGPEPLDPVEIIAIDTQSTKTRLIEHTKEQMVFIQPLNKTESCKLPISPDQISRANFRAFWDGACKTGYAHGFGRDIAISDTHHVEKITVYGLSKDEYRTDKSIGVYYDFVNHIVFYGRVNAEERIGLTEQIIDEPYSFHVRLFRGFQLTDGTAIGEERSPLSPVVTLYSINPNIGYVLNDYSNYPGIVKTQVSRIDPTSRKENGFRLTYLKDGSWVHDAVSDSVITGAAKVSKEYLEYVSNIFDKAIQQRNEAEGAIQAGKELERQYLAKFCNVGYKISNLQNTVAKRICTWRDAFSSKYETQVKKARSQLAEAEAKVVLQERAVLERSRQELSGENPTPDRQIDNFAINQITSVLRGFSQSMQDASRGFSNIPLPQNTPSFGIQNSNGNTQNHLINGTNGLQRRTCTGSGAMQVCF